MLKYFLILILMGLILSACGTQDASLLGGWKLASYGPEGSLIPAVAGSEAGLTFNDDGTVTGNSGCNGIGGEYTVEGDRIEFGQFAITLMACEDPIMSQEGGMHQVLNGAARYVIEGDMLTLSRDGMVLVFSKAGGE